jgi:cytochrome c2
MVFMKNCSQCHSLEAVDPKPKRGPSLGLIYNRRVGSNVDYEHYTNSMLKSAFFWSPLNLYKFMADPSSLVPKTTCGLSKHPLTSESERADLITMFREFTIEMTFNVRLK